MIKIPIFVFVLSGLCLAAAQYRDPQDGEYQALILAEISLKAAVAEKEKELETAKDGPARATLAGDLLMMQNSLAALEQERSACSSAMDFRSRLARTIECLVLAASHPLAGGVCSIRIVQDSLDMDCGLIPGRPLHILVFPEVVEPPQELSPNIPRLYRSLTNRKSEILVGNNQIPAEKPEEEYRLSMTGFLDSVFQVQDNAAAEVPDPALQVQDTAWRILYSQLFGALNMDFSFLGLSGDCTFSEPLPRPDVQSDPAFFEISGRTLTFHFQGDNCDLSWSDGDSSYQVQFGKRGGSMLVTRAEARTLKETIILHLGGVR